MISFLRGVVLNKDKKGIILLVGDIGYKIIAGNRFLEKIKEKDNLEVYIHYQQREDAVNLYGFNYKSELDLFNELISISGVGPKSAIHLLDLLGVKEIQAAIANKRPDILAKAHGLGKKTAERIIIEMKGKFIDFIDDDNGIITNNDEVNDVINALVGLGYSLYDAKIAIKELPAEIEGVDNKIKEVLKSIGKKK